MNLLFRAIVALIFIPVIIFSIIKGGIYIDIFLLIISFGGIYEYKKIIGDKIFNGNILVFGLVTILLLIIKNSSYTLASIFLVLPISFRYLIAKKGDDFKGNLSELALNVLPFIYILFPLTLFSEMYSNNIYQKYLPHIGIFLLMNIWVNDSFAYFTGRLFGKRKLAPKISPKKSIEGFVGGLIFAIIATVIYNYFYPFLPVLHMIILSIIVSIFGPIGDLFESVIKREFNVKDSSNLIPGHGGILDRFDSFLFTIPFYFVYIKLLINL